VRAEDSVGAEPAPDQHPVEGRARAQAGARNEAHSAAVRTLPKRVKTLPPDGLVLEELIANLQAQYGTPSTPQEYRLLIRVPTSEEAAASPAAEPAEEGIVEEEALPRAPSRTGRRRRRGRRASGSASLPAPAGEAGADEDSAGQEAT
jgi:hypothetical protein